MTGGHVWQGACITGDMHDRGKACKAGEGHVWQVGIHGSGHAWQGACMTGKACKAGGMHGREYRTPSAANQILSTIVALFN